MCPGIINTDSFSTIMSAIDRPPIPERIWSRPSRDDNHNMPMSIVIDGSCNHQILLCSKLTGQTVIVAKLLPR